MKGRNTFTAVSFPVQRLESADTISIVRVDDGEIANEENLTFRPLTVWGTSHSQKSSRSQKSFKDVFGQLEKLIADHNRPVVGWGAENRELLSKLVDTYGIDIQYPIRYFDLQAYACKKMGLENITGNWRSVAERLGVEVSGKPIPTAMDCAKLHLALEATDYGLIVARAFLAFIKSIMDDDNRIDTFEAKSLQAFLSLLTRNFNQFEDLRNMVDQVLEDDVVEPQESNLLMDKLGEMRKHYQDYVDSCDRK